jgi:Type II secretion system (T2SS), protein N
VVLAVVLAALPAALIGRFLPPGVRAEDFSGTIWHGSTGRLTVGGRDAGALEWHLHPAALLRLRVAADLHWVQGSFELDGSAEAGKSDFSASGISGGGPITNLQSLGVPPGWRGTAGIRIERLAVDLSGPAPMPRSAVGEIDVADAASPQIAAGTDLGSYALKFDDPSLGADGQATAALTDTGGPLSLDATVTLSPRARTGLLSGTLQERGQIPEALRRELDQIGQLHARDARGRIPVDLEFSY